MLAIDEGCALLQENPYLGIEMPRRPAYRQLFIPFGKSAYVLRYRIDQERDTLAVVRVWHGRESRRWDRNLAMTRYLGETTTFFTLGSMC